MSGNHLQIQKRHRIVTLLIVSFFLCAQRVSGGPPFRTDDPIPIGYRQGEIYLFSTGYTDAGGFTGIGPAIEFNYGALPDVHLHVVLPLAFSSPSGSPLRMGYGDTELGIKYKFVQQTDALPDIATFPIVEAPTGNSSRGLGNGNFQFYLPIWLQKDFGKWTVYGGAGYWINRGTGNEDWSFSGILVQYNFTEDLFLGVEFLHQTQSSIASKEHSGIHIGGGIPIASNYQVIFSADAGTGFSPYKHFLYYIGIYHKI